MGKGKKPRKPKPPEEELEATDAPPPPPREPVRLPQPRSPLPEHRPPAPSRPVLFELIQTIRAAVGAMLDIADAAAEAITKRIEGRA